MFDKRTADKLHKPRRKETISEMLRHGVRQLERCRHPRLLHVLHSVEETGDTLAFATEPVATSLGNALAALEDRAAETSASIVDGTLSVSNGTEIPNGGRRNSTRDIKMPPPADYAFLDIEIKYGILQVFIRRKTLLETFNCECQAHDRCLICIRMFRTKKNSFNMSDAGTRTPGARELLRSAF